MTNLARRIVRTAVLLGVVAAGPADAQQTVGTVQQLKSAVQAANSGSGPATILLQDGTYAMDAFLWITRDGLTLRGESGNRDAVVLDGGGMSSGITHIVQVAAHDVTLENLTLQGVVNHAVQIHGENPYSADRTVLRNCVFRDTYEQMVKVSYNNASAASADDGLVENCLFEYTAGIGPQWYIGGIDAHQSKNWVIRGNTFRGIRSPGAQVAEHAIHFWSNAGGTLVEKNIIVNCDRGIGFGLGTNRGHSGGIIRNNMIYHEALGADRGDVSIELETAVGTEVYANTIYQAHSYQAAISVRFGGSSAYVANNLIKITGGGNRAIWKRDGATTTQEGNVLGAQASWFRDLAGGDLHLSGEIAGVVDAGVAIGGLTEDIDGDGRPQGAAPDVGADEWTASGGGNGGGGSGGGSGGSAIEDATWARVKGAYR